MNEEVINALKYKLDMQEKEIEKLRQNAEGLESLHMEQFGKRNALLFTGFLTIAVVGISLFQIPEIVKSQAGKLIEIQVGEEVDGYKEDLYAVRGEIDEEIKEHDLSLANARERLRGQLQAFKEDVKSYSKGANGLLESLVVTRQGIQSIARVFNVLDDKEALAAIGKNLEMLNSDSEGVLGKLIKSSQSLESALKLIDDRKKILEMIYEPESRKTLLMQLQSLYRLQETLSDLKSMLYVKKGNDLNAFIGEKEFEKIKGEFNNQVREVVEANNSVYLRLSGKELQNQNSNGSHLEGLRERITSRVETIRGFISTGVDNKNSGVLKKQINAILGLENCGIDLLSPIIENRLEHVENNVYSKIENKKRTPESRSPL